tara:strand:+ start:67 stop:492 length:426 start_codon:yes stop_codon:yes gene_type:complete
MATRTDLRPRGVEGYTVARDELRALIVSALDKAQTSSIKSEVDPESFHPEECIIIANTQGAPALVNTEGVGGFANLTKGSKATIEVWFSIGEYGYLRSIDLPVHDVIALSTSTPHDLADFIRTFGDRLDTNHSLWYNWAKS